ncbi:MAG: trimeric intracellular cation channel family protein [Polynucleobacter sp.]|nr:MAG: trimeric intracellular cation channel family protein [Polynucleobacter sp.]
MFTNHLTNFIYSDTFANNLTFAIEIMGTLAFALAGIVVAARKRLDIVGVSMVCGLSAFGGGTLRDILLDRRPFFWVEHHQWLWVILALCIAAMLFLRKKHIELTEKSIQIPDALGLAMFTISGTQITLASGSPLLVSVLMGVMTAIFGGVLRDIACNEIPQAFSDHRPYAVIAFAGSWIYLAIEHFSNNDWLASIFAFLVIVTLRMLAIKFDWTIPSWASK